MKKLKMKNKVARERIKDIMLSSKKRPKSRTASKKKFKRGKSDKFRNIIRKKKEILKQNIVKSNSNRLR